MSRVLLAFALVLLVRPVFAQTAAARPQARYDTVELGGLASKNFSFVRGLNVSGQVAGLSGESNGTDSRAVLWTPDGVEVLGTLPGGDSSASSAVNNSGHVVGTSNTATGVRAFLWTKYGGMQDLGTLPGDKGSEAFHINNVGQVVGTSSGPRGIRAVLWQANGLVQLLGTLPGGNFSRAVGINDSGEVIGNSGALPGRVLFSGRTAGECGISARCRATRAAKLSRSTTRARWSAIRAGPPGHARSSGRATGG